MADKPALEIILERLAVSHEWEYNIRYLALKEMLKEMSDKRFEDVISQFSSTEGFKYLLAAGLNQYRQNVLTRRVEEERK